MSSRGIVGVPVKSGGRGRPRLVIPVDQRVTLVVTAPERARANIEAARGNKGTLASLIRNRAVRSIDMNEWLPEALSALETLRREESERDLLRRQIAQTNRSIESAKMGRNAASVDALSSTRDELHAKYTSIGGAPTKRDSRIVGRLTLVDYEVVAWRAARLHITISDYLRIMLFNLSPGQSDKHLSANSRRRFYESIIEISRDGWGEPPRSSSDKCPHCGESLR